MFDLEGAPVWAVTTSDSVIIDDRNSFSTKAEVVVQLPRSHTGRHTSSQRLDAYEGYLAHRVGATENSRFGRK